VLGKGRPSSKLEADKERLDKVSSEILKHVPRTGDPAGNAALRRRLAVSSLKVKEDEYWTARNSLVANGILTKGRGRGGSVYLAKPEKGSSARSTTKKTETALYAPFESATIAGYIPDNEIKQHIIERTAQPRARITGGRWTRPDLTLIAMRQYQFLPGKKI
jgi:hypothetical protein